MVSFERVFEVVDLPQDIPEKENAIRLVNPHGDLEFDNVTFNYQVDKSMLLKAVKRFGRGQEVDAVLSGGASDSNEKTEG
jgi:ATP-binding cassette subfamily B protein